MIKLQWQTMADEFCCGVIRVGMFKLGITDDEVWRKCGMRWPESLSEEDLRGLGKPLLDSLSLRRLVHCTTYASNGGRQWKIINGILEACGFEQTKTFVNGNTGNSITFWTKVT